MHLQNQITAKGVYDLTPDEIKTLVHTSRLGVGLDISTVNIHNDALPRFTRPVLSPPSLLDPPTRKIASNCPSVSSAFTPRDAAYAKAGWGKGYLLPETPWVKASVAPGGDSRSVRGAYAGTEMFVTGRQVLAFAELEVPTSIGLNEDLRREVQAAVITEDLKVRKEMVEDIFTKWGHFFVSKVEMGGAISATVAKTTTDNLKAKDYEKGMEYALRKMIRPDQIKEGASGGTSKSAVRIPAESEFNTSSFVTVGGDITIDDLAQWKSTLRDWKTWEPVRITAIRPLISLLPPSVREKIAECEPKPIDNAYPLYRLWASGGDHLYTMDQLERKVLTKGVHYVSEGVTAKILRSEVWGSVPLYRAWHPKKYDHFYTASFEEYQKATRPGGDYNAEGITGYLFNEKKEGTVELWRCYSEKLVDHFYTTSSDEYETKVVCENYRLEGVVGWVYPAETSGDKCV